MISFRLKNDAKSEPNGLFGEFMMMHLVFELNADSNSFSSHFQSALVVRAPLDSFLPGLNGINRHLASASTAMGA